MVIDTLNPIARIDMAYLTGVARTPETPPGVTAWMGMEGVRAIQDRRLDPVDFAQLTLEGSRLNYIFAATAAIHGLFGVRNVDRLKDNTAFGHRLGVRTAVSSAVDFANAEEFKGRGCTILKTIDLANDQSQQFAEFAAHPIKLGDFLWVLTGVSKVLCDPSSPADAAIITYQNKIVDIARRFRGGPVEDLERQMTLDGERDLLSEKLLTPAYQEVRNAMPQYSDDTLHTTVTNLLRWNPGGKRNVST